MRKFLALCGAVLCCVAVAAAQDNSAAPAAAAGSASAAPAPVRYAPLNNYPWQVAVIYEYTRFRPGSGASTFRQNGVGASITRYYNDWFGLEGDVTADFGRTTSPWGPLPIGNLVAKTVFYGGGAHIAYRQNDKLEPWFHIVAGGAHFRFSTTAAGPQTANAFAYKAGGGLDLKIGPRLSFRAQADYLGTRFFSTFQHNFQVGGGVVLNF